LSDRKGKPTNIKKSVCEGRGGVAADTGEASGLSGHGGQEGKQDLLREEGGKTSELGRKKGRFRLKKRKGEGENFTEEEVKRGPCGHDREDVRG